MRAQRVQEGALAIRARVGPGLAPGLAKLLVALVVVALLAAATGNARIAAARPDPAFVGLGLASGQADSGGNVHLRMYVDNGGRNEIQASVRIEEAGTASTPASTLWAGSVRVPAGAAGTFDATAAGACGVRLSVLLTAPAQARSLDVLVDCASP